MFSIHVLVVLVVFNAFIARGVNGFRFARSSSVTLAGGKFSVNQRLNGFRCRSVPVELGSNLVLASDLGFWAQTAGSSVEAFIVTLQTKLLGVIVGNIAAGIAVKIASDYVMEKASEVFVSSSQNLLPGATVPQCENAKKEVTSFAKEALNYVKKYSPTTKQLSAFADSSRSRSQPFIGDVNKISKKIGKRAISTFKAVQSELKSDKTEKNLKIWKINIKKISKTDVRNLFLPKINSAEKKVSSSAPYSEKFTKFLSGMEATNKITPKKLGQNGTAHSKKMNKKSKPQISKSSNKTILKAFF